MVPSATLRIAPAAAIALCWALFGGGAQAQVFDLDWTADTVDPAFSGVLQERGDVVIEDQTPFLYERVGSASTGFYYHMILGEVDANGDPVDGFAQEVYISLSGIDSGAGQNFDNIGPSGSASAGLPVTGEDPDGNNLDPLNSLGAISGNATGNPESVILRQLVQDGELSLEFLKNEFAEKPNITTEINASDMNSLVVIDSSGLTYDDASTAAVLTNTLLILDPDIPEDSARFDINQDSEQSSVTAGRFTYTPGGGPAGSEGSYTYSEGGANLSPDWSSFFDHGEDNPWGYAVNRPVE